MQIGSMIMKKRKELGYTQQALAEKLNVSYQAVSKWEKGTACPEISLLPILAEIFGISIDSLLGHKSVLLSDYEERYKSSDFYWGLKPSNLCYEIMKMKPPVEPVRVLDIGCGEGKDAVFLAKNGYLVSAFDVTETGIEKGKALAEKYGVYVDFFRADINEYRLSEAYDIIFSSGVFHFIRPELRETITNDLKCHTKEKGINVVNVFVEKPFVPVQQGKEKDRYRWKSGELFMHYSDWRFHKMEETIFDCHSGAAPHQHCMDTMIAQKG